MSISYVPAFEPPGLVLHDNFWDPGAIPDVEKGPPILTHERQFLDSAISRTTISIEAISHDIEILQLRVTGEWKLVEGVQFVAPTSTTPEHTFIDLARLVFSTSQPMTHDERADFNAANRPFARPLAVLPKKQRSI